MRHLGATICLTVALLLGSAGMSWSADFQKGLDAVRKGDFATALREWKPLAEQGNARAQNNLGSMYRTGKGVPENDKTAVKWYRLAAEQGYGNAQSLLGFMYDNGLGVPQDYKTAVKWYRLAAEQGVAFAQSNLGVMYEKGRGVPQNDKTAVKWYRLAAEKGYGNAQKEVEKLEKKIAEKIAERKQRGIFSEVEFRIIGHLASLYLNYRNIDEFCGDAISLQGIKAETQKMFGFFKKHTEIDWAKGVIPNDKWEKYTDKAWELSGGSFEKYSKSPAFQFMMSQFASMTKNQKNIGCQKKVNKDLQSLRMRNHVLKTKLDAILNIPKRKKKKAF